MKVSRRFCALLLVLTWLMAGCWDRTEVNDLAIITMVGMDKSPGGIRVSVNVAVPLRLQNMSAGSEGSSGQEGRAALTYSAEGETVLDAARKLQEKISRRIFWAHARVMVIGEDLAREGVATALDFWTRHREPRMLMQVVVTAGEARELLAQQPRLERMLTEAIRETLNLRLQVRLNLLDFITGLRTPGEEPIAPVIALVPGEPTGMDVAIKGTALFQGDKLVGFLDVGETRGLLWLRGEIEQGVTTFDLPTGGKASLQVVRATTRVEPKIVQGKLRLDVRIITESDLHEVSGRVDVSKSETLEILKDLAKRDLQARLKSALTKIQKEYKVDALRFGDAVRRGMPQWWKSDLKDRWVQVFPTVPVDFHVDLYIRRTGEHGPPLAIDPEVIKKGQQEMMKR